MMLVGFAGLGFMGLTQKGGMGGLATGCKLLGDRPLHRSWILAECALGQSASVV
jgi:hypothetical protein